MIYALAESLCLRRFIACILFWRNGQHRYFGRAYYSIGNAPNQKAANGTVTAGTHDNQVNGMLLSVLHYLFSSATFPNGSFNPESTLGQFRCNLVQVTLSLALPGGKQLACQIYSVFSGYEITVASMCHRDLV